MELRFLTCKKPLRFKKNCPGSGTRLRTVEDERHLAGTSEGCMAFSSIEEHVGFAKRHVFALSFMFPQSRIVSDVIAEVFHFKNSCRHCPEPHWRLPALQARGRWDSPRVCQETSYRMEVVAVGRSQRPPDLTAPPFLDTGSVG